MSEATLLDMVNTVATEVRFPTVTNVLGNKDENTVAIYTALKKAMERDVYRAHPWAALRGYFEVAFDGSTNYWPLPLDWDSPLNSTAWDVINQRPARGALDPYQYQKISKSQLTIPNQTMFYTITSYDFGVQGGGTRKAMLFYPTPMPETLVYDDQGSATLGVGFSMAYMTNWYVLDASTRAKKRSFGSDGDLTLIDSELVEQATLVRMLRTLGLGFAEEKIEFDMMLQNRKQKDGGSTDLDMTGPHDMAPAYPNTPGFVPGGGWWGSTRSGRW